MKKKIALLLAMTMIFSCSTVAFGAQAKTTTIKNGNGGQLSDAVKQYSDEQEITAKYVQDAGTVYSVDVVWGSMQFIYSVNGVWNPEKLQMTGGSDNGWSVAKPADNDVKVVNRSNAAVMIDMDATMNTNYSNGDIFAEFAEIKDSADATSTVTQTTGVADANLSSAVGTDDTSVPTLAKEIKLSGELKDDAPGFVVIGSATVTIDTTTTPGP